MNETKPNKRTRGRQFNIHVRVMSEEEFTQVAQLFIDAYRDDCRQKRKEAELHEQTAGV